MNEFNNDLESYLLNFAIQESLKGTNDSEKVIEKDIGNDIKKKVEDSSQDGKKDEKKVIKPVQKKKNRCWECKRKVGVLGYECKCSYIFCAKHRLSFDHNCDYDFKSDVIKKLEKENPVVKKKKIDPI